MKNHPVNNDYVQNLVEGLINEADYAEGTGLNRAQNPNYRRQLARKLRRTRNAETVGGAIESAEDTTTPLKAGKSTVSDLNKKAFMSNPAAKDSMRRGAETIASKKKEMEGEEVQTESFDIVDSRLSPEDAKIDQNVKTRGVKKVRGQKPVPMVNSAGETVGEQDAGHRPRSQDLNTRGRLNKSREGEGMLAKGKRFIKKKFA